MKFYFCEKCGARITEKEITEGLGKDKKLKGVYCTSCSVGVMTMESLPLTEAQAEKILESDKSPSSVSSTPARRTSGAVRRPTAKASAHVTGRLPTGRLPTGRLPTGRIARGARGTKAPQETARSNNGPARGLVLAVGGAILLLAAGLFFMSGSSTPRKRAKTSKRTVLVKQIAKARKTVAPTPGSAHPREGAPKSVAQAAAASVKGGPRPRAKTPKELYEERLANGAAKPFQPPPQPKAPKAPPAAPAKTTPPPSDIKGRLLLADRFEDGTVGHWERGGKVVKGGYGGSAHALELAPAKGRWSRMARAARAKITVAGKARMRMAIYITGARNVKLQFTARPHRCSAAYYLGKSALKEGRWNLIDKPLSALSLENKKKIQPGNVLSYYFIFAGRKGDNCKIKIDDFIIYVPD